jgi:hypothetical protein
MSDTLQLLNWIFQDVPHFLGTVVLLVAAGAALGLVIHGPKN